jgi:hypothetical protein
LPALRKFDSPPRVGQRLGRCRDRIPSEQCTGEAVEERAIRGIDAIRECLEVDIKAVELPHPAPRPTRGKLKTKESKVRGKAVVGIEPAQRSARLQRAHHRTHVIPELVILDHRECAPVAAETAGNREHP